MHLQNLMQSGLKSGFRLTETIAPAIAHRWAINLFVQPIKFKRPPREAALIQDAIIEEKPFTGFYPRPATQAHYITYRWGSGPVVLLVHGWAGRGSQMATFAAPLVAAGYGVLTFDAPAHGDSPSKQTNLLEVSQIIQELANENGGFAAIIGHSFGGMAAGYALQHGAQAQKLVTIGSPATMEQVLTGFGTQINASAKTIRKLTTHLEQLANQEVDTFSLSRSLATVTLPGLIVHDQQDNDVAYRQALILQQAWQGSALLTTDGLGHRRILRDDAIIARIVDFVRS